LWADAGEAQKRAFELEGRIDAAVREIVLPDPRKLFGSLRTYLQQRADEGHPQRPLSVYDKIRLHQEDGVAEINLGPSIDKGKTDQHFLFGSGARLSFGLSVKVEKASSRLIAYRFQLHLPANALFDFLRFDLNREKHLDPLREPRCHIHLGTSDVRVLSVVLGPVDLLDRVFFVVEPAFR
jgi:hypothetical protein